MSNTAQPSDLLAQAQTFEDAADALSPKVADVSISLDDRKQIFTQSLVLRSQAFELRSQAAAGIVKNLKIDVAALKSQIDAAKQALLNVANIKSVIDLASGLASTATALATGQPAAITGALVALQKTLASAKSA